MNMQRPALTSLILVAVAGLATACAAPQAQPTSTEPSSTAVDASPSSSPAGSANATEAPVSALEGTWIAPETTCDQQNAALVNAGFSSADLELGGWDEATCGGMMHGSQFTIRFAGEHVVIFQDGVIGWDGTFRIVDEDTFEAGDGDAGFYITSEYTIDGDQLTIDQVRNDYPTSSRAVLLGDQIAGTILVETAPFVRAP